MKIDYIQISNILSFRYEPDISNTEKISFDDGLNIIIGENGSGKSTALEVINFLFKRVLYRQYNVNQDLFTQRSTITAAQRKQIIAPQNDESYAGFRLEPNWDTEDKEQKIRIAIKLDEIDQNNITNLKNNFETFKSSADIYSGHSVQNDDQHSTQYVIDITLNKTNGSFSVNFLSGAKDFGFNYLSEYHFFKEVISIHNFLYPENKVPTLYESFTLISSYRNYHAFQPSVSLKDSHPAQQMQAIRNQDYKRSLNSSDVNEPPIFALVRLQVAEKHFSLIRGSQSDQECEQEANKLPFIISINKRLKVVNLECKIRLIDLRTWQYSFEFTDTIRNKKITDINSLSAGQKAIVHLVFEAYGRGDFKGGVIIIDEPEIHLHYQFQHEYLEVINDLNNDQNCQYILVTHSEALINSNTINNVRRFSLDENGRTRIFSPHLSTDQKSLIKILDNTRSTYAFFAKKVVLVEGDTDRYFFRSVIQEKYKDKNQEIAVIHIGGKGEFIKWKDLFSCFGLSVYIIADLDYIIDLHYPSEKGTGLKKQQAILGFKRRNADWETKINSEYPNQTYILKEGDLESYLSIKKDLGETIKFCNNNLGVFLNDTTSAKSIEVQWIIETIAN